MNTGRLLDYFIAVPKHPAQLPTRRQPGRPSAEERPTARDALLEAASRIFRGHSAADVSLRRIAIHTQELFVEAAA